MRPGSTIEDYVELAKSWRQHLCSGEVRELDWLTTRTCSIDLSGSASDVEPLDREAMVGFARALGEGLADVTWDVDRILQREHQVVVDATVEAHQGGPLDFSDLGGPRLPEGDGRLELPRQRFSWHVVHKRIHEVEVLEGPGLGWDVLADALDLAPQPSTRPGLDRALEDAASAIQDQANAGPSEAVRATNGDGANGHSHTHGSNGSNGKGDSKDGSSACDSTAIAGLSKPVSSNGDGPREDEADESAGTEEEPGERSPPEGSLEAKVDRVIDEHLD